MGRREDKLRAPGELTGLPTQLLGSVARSWRHWAHPAPLLGHEVSPQPEWKKVPRLSQPLHIQEVLLTCFRSHPGGIPMVHTVRSVRLKSGEEVLGWPSVGGGRTSWNFGDTSCKVGCYHISKLKHPLPWGWGTSSWEGKGLGKREMPGQSLSYKE